MTCYALFLCNFFFSGCGQHEPEKSPASGQGEAKTKEKDSGEPMVLIQIHFSYFLISVSLVHKLHYKVSGILLSKCAHYSINKGEVSCLFLCLMFF